MYERLALRRRWPVALLIAASSIAIAAVFGTVGIGNAATKEQPKNTKPPTISGTAQLNQTLTADPGTWTGTQPITFSYQWRRCDKQGNNCSNIGGETGKSYDIRTQDLDHTLRVHVTAKNSDGTERQDSAQTNVVAKSATNTNPAPPTSNGCPSGTGPVSVSQLTSPVVLQIDGQSSDPSPITTSTSDLTLRVHISACSGRSVSGALVETTAVPFNQFSVPPEQATGSDGWATLQLHRGRFFPASPRQQILAVFIRARKPGDPILAGIAGRRLVSFPVRLH